MNEEQKNPKEVSQSWEQNIRFVLQDFRNYLAETNLEGETRIVDYPKFLEQIYKICDERTESALAEQARGIKEKCEEMKKIHRVSFPQSEHEKGLIAGLELGYNQAINDLADYITNTYL